MFEKECETEEINDDLPATQRFVSPQNTLATYHPEKHARMMFCCVIVPLMFRCFIDFGYLHGC